MKWSRHLFCTCAGMAFFAIRLSAADATNEAVTSPPVYVPDMSHASQPLPDGVLAWSSLMETTNAAADLESVRFTFGFTNVSSTDSSIMGTNITALASSTPSGVAIVGVHASCGCTQPEVPQLPWIIPPGGTGEISATVNIGGHSGTMIKSITVTTDKGFKDLYMRITILPPVLPTLTDAERLRDVEIAKADRQAVFKNDCAACHAKPAQNKYGQPLYQAVCAICHEGEQRAAFVTDLHDLKAPTNEEFWRTWIAHGKAGTLMPAFCTAEGGPLTDMQIATLAAYLNATISSRPAMAMTNSPAH